MHIKKPNDRETKMQQIVMQTVRSLGMGAAEARGSA